MEKYVKTPKQNLRLRCEVCGKAIFKSEFAELNICKNCAENYPLEEYVYDLLRQFCVQRGNQKCKIYAIVGQNADAYMNLTTTLIGQIIWMET